MSSSPFAAMTMLLLLRSLSFCRYCSGQCCHSFVDVVAAVGIVVLVLDVAVIVGYFAKVVAAVVHVVVVTLIIDVGFDVIAYKFVVDHNTIRPSKKYFDV